MVNLKTVTIALLLVLLGIWAVVHSLPSEEKKVRKQFDLLAESVSKGRGEGTIGTAQKVQKIRTLFAKNCGLHIRVYSLSGNYTPHEIASHAARARLRFSRLSLRFYDLDIEFPEEGTAKVTLTARLTGTTTTGEHVDETRELECVLKRTDGKWLFSDCTVVEVLRK